jgi:hypothetical protein
VSRATPTTVAVTRDWTCCNTSVRPTASTVPNNLRAVCSLTTTTAAAPA